jgi:hypothetical protein
MSKKAKDIVKGLSTTVLVTIAPSDVDGSSDACGIDSIVLSKTTYLCRYYPG